MRERFNAKARQSSLHKKKKQRFVKLKQKEPDATPTTTPQTDVTESTQNDEYVATTTPVPILLDQTEPKTATQNILDLLPQRPEGKISSKKRKRLQKFIESQLKKEERVKLVKKLGSQHLDENVEKLLKSSKDLGKVRLTAKEKLKQSLTEYRSGLPISDNSVQLFVEKEQGGSESAHDDMDDFDDEVSDQESRYGAIDADRSQKFGGFDSMIDDGEEGSGSEEDNEDNALARKANAFGSSLASAGSAAFGSAIRRTEDGNAAPIVVVKRKKKKKQVKKRKEVVERKFSGVSSDEDESEEEPEQEGLGGEHNEEEEKDSHEASDDEESTRVGKKSKGPSWNSNVVDGVAFPEHQKTKTADPKPKPKSTSSKSDEGAVDSADVQPANKYYVQIHRTPEQELARTSLPILREEHTIMETILHNTTTILCGETGSGKTTQLPQFLYEYGFANPAHPLYGGMICITQPRRVAAVSMATRVAEEMGSRVGEGPVGYQIRYDTATVSANTKIKFVTEGILLRELSAAVEKEGGDLLLTKYSVIVIDEAHERTVGTDVLIGWLTRIATLRNSGKIGGVTPLKLVIMSATLRVEDFTGNKVLFPPEQGVPPVIKVDGRQFKVTIHYNKITPEKDYVTEAFKKVSKIHTKLPHGAILVFLTGQSEIMTLVKRLRNAYPSETTPEDDKKRHAGSRQVIGTVESDANLSMFGETEDGIVDDADESIGAEGVDDFDEGEFLDEDDEEEETHVLEGDEGDDDPIEATDEVDRNKQPLFVLPLYSLLPTEAQMRVFEAPPAGTRLCVVATNVAETSLTIPGVKYVVDCGKVKERKYDTTTGVQKFQIGWTSRASADQRAGRAGRVSPGHCYRLFSSAVFANHFDQFSRPEMLRTPIEGVVLQMKSMGISNVVNFPFPTPPARENLRAAETLLMHLGAIEKGNAASENSGKITELGKILAKFPVSPRYAKMLVISADQPKYCLAYTITLVSGLSVGDPFVRDDAVAEEKEDGSEDEKSKMIGAFHKAMQMFAGDQPTSDALRILRAVGAYSAITSSKDADNFLQSHFLRKKAMEEISRLRGQLASLVRTSLSRDLPGLQILSSDSSWFSSLPPPTMQDTVQLRQLVLAGFPDQIARFDVEATRHAVASGLRNVKPIYSTMWGSKTDIYTIHPSSCISSLRPAPEWILYEEVMSKEERLSADNSQVLFAEHTKATVSDEVSRNRRLMLKNVTIISETWISKLGPKTLLKHGKLLDQPSPRYDAAKDKVIGFAIPNYGPKMWELGISEVGVEVKSAVQWFAHALLVGQVKPGRFPGKRSKRANSPPDLFGVLLPYLSAKPSIIVKSWSKVQSKVNSLLSALLSKKVVSKKDLIREWYLNTGFLLPEYLAWLPSELHMAVQLCWPPVEFVEEFEKLPTNLSGIFEVPPAKERLGIQSKLEPFLSSLPKQAELRYKDIAVTAAIDSGDDSD